MKTLANCYQLLNVLSLDVAAGAIISALFFARIFEVQILPFGVLALGLTVWIIYTADHLVDAKRVPSPAATRRHRFHQDHFMVLTRILVVAALVDGIVILFIRKPVLHSGLVLTGAVVIYFLFQRRLAYAKEFCGAALYSVGVLLPAWSLSPASISLSQGMLIVQFCITVLCNMLLFSLFDYRQDLRDHRQSFATVMGNEGTRFFLLSLFGLNGVLMLIQFVWTMNSHGTLFSILFMNLLLMIILIFHEQFRTNDRYRLVGDAIFLVPLFIIVV